MKDLNYKLLGKVTGPILTILKEEVYKHRNQLPFQSVFISPSVKQQFYEKLFTSKLQQYIEHSKVFITAPGGFYPIHKDGADRKCALNVAIDCNLTDWVRWYSTDDILLAGGIEYTDQGTYKNGSTFYSRNVRVTDFEVVPYIEEVRNQVGDVYLVNTDVYHSFKNNGLKDRLIIQTKFKNNPTIKEVYDIVMDTGINLE